MSIIETFTVVGYRHIYANSTQILPQQDSFRVYYLGHSGVADNRLARLVFNGNDETQMRAILNNRNFVIDALEISIPQNTVRYPNYIDLNIGYNLSSDSPNVLRDGRVYRTAPTYQPWYSLDTAFMRTFAANAGSCLIICAAQNTYDAYYTNEVDTGSPIQFTIRITYHGNNSTFEFDSDTGEFGANLQVDITAHQPDYTHTIKYSVGEANTTVTLNAGILTHTFAPPMAWIAQIPNAVTATLSAQLTTYDGDTIVGEQPTIYIAIDVPSNVVPVVGSIAYTVDNPLNVPISNRGLVATLSGYAGVYGSTVRSYTLQCEGYSASNERLVMDVIQRIPTQGQSRNIVITATVTDSRGRTATAAQSVTVYEWDVPFFSALTFYRCNSNGVKSEDGHYIRVEGAYECFSVNSLNSIEPCTLKIVERSTGTETDAGQLAQNTPKIIGGGNLSADEEYALRLTLTDEVATIVYEKIIYSAAYVIHFKHGGNGVAFGQAATENDTVRVNPSWAFIIGNNIDVAQALAALDARISALEG